MLVIRFLRVGKKNQPSFKIVVVDKRRSSKSGSFVEEVGFYNPLTKEKVLKAERIKYWISVGAKPSPTIYNLLISEKILEGKKIPKHNKPKKQEEKPAVAEVQAAKEEKPKEAKVVLEVKPEAKTPAPVETPAGKEPSVAKAMEGKEKLAEKKEVKIPQKVESPKEEKPPETKKE